MSASLARSFSVVASTISTAAAEGVRTSHMQCNVSHVITEIIMSDPIRSNHLSSCLRDEVIVHDNLHIA